MHTLNPVQVRTHIKDIYQQDADAPTESSTIPCLACGVPGVKPSTVLYGRALPQAFFQALKVRGAVVVVVFVAACAMIMCAHVEMLHHVAGERSQD